MDQEQSYRVSSAIVGDEANSIMNTRDFVFLRGEANAKMHRNKKRVKRYIFEGESNHDQEIREEVKV